MFRSEIKGHWPFVGVRRVIQKLRFSQVRQFRFVLTTARVRSSGQVSAIAHNHDAPKEGEHHAGSLFQTAITYRAIAQ